MDSRTNWTPDVRTIDASILCPTGSGAPEPWGGTGGGADHPTPGWGPGTRTGLPTGFLLMAPWIFALITMMMVMMMNRTDVIILFVLF